MTKVIGQARSGGRKLAALVAVAVSVGGGTFAGETSRPRPCPRAVRRRGGVRWKRRDARLGVGRDVALEVEGGSRLRRRNDHALHACGGRHDRAYVFVPGRVRPRDSAGGNRDGLAGQPQVLDGQGEWRGPLRPWRSLERQRSARVRRWAEHHLPLTSPCAAKMAALHMGSRRPGGYLTVKEASIYRTEMCQFTERKCAN